MSCRNIARCCLTRRDETAGSARFVYGANESNEIGCAAPLTDIHLQPPPFYSNHVEIRGGVLYCAL